MIHPQLGPQLDGPLTSNTHVTRTVDRLWPLSQFRQYFENIAIDSNMKKNFHC